MGEKEIVQDGPGTTPGGTPGPTPGSGPGTTGGPTKPDPTTPGQTDGPPKTQAKDDPCGDLKARADDLLAQLEALHQQNRAYRQKALSAFFGPRGGTTADGYAHWLTQSKVTEAVVDSNNAVGKNIIDVAMFAIGGWGGLGEVGAPQGFAKAAQAAYGGGLPGSRSYLDLFGKLGLKVLEKAGDEALGYKAGKMSSGVIKTVTKLEDPAAWFQGINGTIESIGRGAIIDALGDWMKKGATSGDLERAKEAFADFAAAALVANTTAASALQLVLKLQDLIEEARAKGCPEPVIPDDVFYTFDLAQLGVGAFQGQAGPTMHSHSIMSGVDRTWDLFASVSDTSSLPF